jgi:dipeptidyl aminopeptidase/acylaminoacyl peptidase
VGTEKEEAPVLMMMGGTQEDMPDAWNQASPPFHADADDPPVLIAHGTADASVDPAHSVALHKAIQEAGGQSTLILVEGAKHGFHRVDEHNLPVRCVLEPLLTETLGL